MGNTERIVYTCHISFVNQFTETNGKIAYSRLIGSQQLRRNGNKTLVSARKCEPDTVMPKILYQVSCMGSG